MTQTKTKIHVEDAAAKGNVAAKEIQIVDTDAEMG
jgi:hypothetical protein